MARIKLTLSANAGGVLELGSHRLLIDALHNRKVPGFSTLTDDMERAIFSHENFCSPELICVTHEHADHYSKSLVQASLERWPSAKCLMPQQRQIASGDMDVSFFPLIHDGLQYQNVKHFGVLISWNGKHILIPGDCQIADANLLQAVSDVQIDLAILNFPWLTLKKGRVCLEQALQPKQCVFWHLPFAQDDVNHYRHSAEAALHQYSGSARLLCDPFQTIELDI